MLTTCFALHSLCGSGKYQGVHLCSHTPTTYTTTTTGNRFHEPRAYYVLGSVPSILYQSEPKKGSSTYKLESLDKEASTH